MLLKESIDNSIDEFNEGFGKKIEIDIKDDLTASIRDYGRGIPLGSLVPAVSKLNTGGKYDNDQYTASVGLNGVGLKAVNALSTKFIARTHRDGQYREAIFEGGKLVSDVTGETEEDNGTFIYFEPDAQLSSTIAFTVSLSKRCCATTPISTRDWLSIITDVASSLAMDWKIFSPTI